MFKKPGFSLYISLLLNKLTIHSQHSTKDFADILHETFLTNKLLFYGLCFSQLLYTNGVFVEYSVRALYFHFPENVF